MISKTFNNLKQANKCQQILQNSVPLQQSVQDVPEIYFMHSTNFCFFLISICQGLGIHLRYVRDIVLRHEAQGIKDTCNRGKKRSKAFPRTSWEDGDCLLSNQKPCLWGLLLQLLSEQREKASGFHRKRLTSQL